MTPAPSEESSVSIAMQASVPFVMIPGSSPRPSSTSGAHERHAALLPLWGGQAAGRISSPSFVPTGARLSLQAVPCTSQQSQYQEEPRKWEGFSAEAPLQRRCSPSRVDDPPTGGCLRDLRGRE